MIIILRLNILKKIEDTQQIILHLFFWSINKWLLILASVINMKLLANC